MALTIDDVVTHYVLSSHPRNRAIIDIKNKKTGELRFIKIRHRLSNFYAVSLVDPVTFEVWAETQVKTAASRVKPITLHLDENNKNDTPAVELRDTSRIGFEWSFIWEGEKYRWVRESRMSNSLECKAVRKTGDICVAQYLPRILKDEYFGIFSLLGYNMLRCDLTKSRELELILLMSLMTLLDKADDGSWKRDPIGKGVQDDLADYCKNNNNNDIKDNKDDEVLPIAYEDPIPKKALQKKYRVELLNDQKLQLMLEKDVRRSQKQIQSDQKQKPLSAGNSPSQTPKSSPLPTPSVSSTLVDPNPPRLTRQKSACNLSYYKETRSSEDVNNDSNISPVFPVGGTNKAGRLSKLFSSLSHKQTNSPPSSSSSSVTNTPKEPTNTSPLDEKKQSNIYKSNDSSQKNCVDQKYQNKSHQRPPQYEHHQRYERSFPYYENQYSYPIGQVPRFTNEFGNLVINNHHFDSPPSLRSIRWNPEPISSAQTSAPIVQNTETNKYISTQRSSRQQQPVFTTQQVQHHSNSQDRRRPRVLDEQRRLSGSEYSIYGQHPHQQHQNYGYLPSSSTNNYTNNQYAYNYQPQQQYYYQ